MAWLTLGAVYSYARIMKHISSLALPKVDEYGERVCNPLVDKKGGSLILELARASPRRVDAKRVTNPLSILEAHQRSAMPTTAHALFQSLIEGPLSVSVSLLAGSNHRFKSGGTGTRDRFRAGSCQCRLNPDAIGGIQWLDTFFLSRLRLIRSGIFFHGSSRLT